jgi:preprotein translocase subunit SecE
LARDRKRAKQRRERAARGASSTRRRGLPELGDLPETKPVRTEIPGALEHASGDADEFEAAIVRGADGAVLPGTPEDDEAAVLDAENELAEPEMAAAVPQEPEEEEQQEDEGEDLLQEPASAAFGGRGGGGGAAGGALAERPSGAPLRGGNRVVGFLRASWAELQRVQWPDRRHVTQATAVVLGFVVVAGVYLGLADLVAKEIVELMGL